MPSILSLRQISKRLRGRLVLNDVSAEIGRGEIVGLLGGNGAGKSTLLGIIVGQVLADAGSAEIGGLSVDDPRSRRALGAVWEFPAFYEQLSGWENLALLASYSREVSEVDLQNAIETAGLSARIHEPVRLYSHGMRRRLALAQALVPRPRLLVLDEPLDGLDPLALREWRSILTRLRDEYDAAVLISSHQLAEVERLADRILILHEGRLVFAGRWPEGQSVEECFVAAIGRP